MYGATAVLSLVAAFLTPPMHGCVLQAVVTKAIRRQRFLDMKRRSLDAVLLQKVSVANSEAEAQIQADGSTIRRVGVVGVWKR